jgi:asparagine synthase (glutamine-hydrolysing)
MASVGGRYVLSYNGEIYNFRSLRRRLEGCGHRFRGHSDTEVLLSAIQQWNLDGALERINGMFALALWDRKEGRLHLARDRFGEKPLYYSRMGNTVLFGSELKALRVHPAFTADVNRNALTLFFRHGYIPAPHSIYCNVWKVLPATYLTIWPSMPANTGQSTRYWSLPDASQPCPSRPEADVLDATEELLREAVDMRMEADVPLGAFLSGGIDSSTIVALMQARSSSQVKTFTVGFDDPRYDESPAAAAVARHLGSEHFDLRVTPAEVRDAIPRIPAIYDEPFADTSQLPTVLVSELARSKVTVALSGDGGDEVFGGYNRYTWSPSIWRRLRPIPLPVRRATATALTSVSPAVWDSLFVRGAQVLPRRLRVRTPGMKMHKLAGVLPSEDFWDMYYRLVSVWADPNGIVIGGAEAPSPLTNELAKDQSRWDPVKRMMYLDALTYLPDDILTKVDRATMSVNLEARVPLLDHRLVEHVWSLPADMIVRNGRGKWLLRQVLERHVPASLLERPKAGFSLPIDEWLRGPLRDWAESLLDPRRLAREGFVDPDPVRRLWTDQLQGRLDGQDRLWVILMFEAWLESVDGWDGGGRGRKLN